MSREQKIYNEVISGKSYQEVAIRLSLSRERVRQIFRKYEEGVEVPPEDLRPFWRALGSLRRLLGIPYSSFFRSGNLATARHILSGNKKYTGQYDVKGRKARDRVIVGLMREINKRLDELDEPIKELGRIAHSQN